MTTKATNTYFFTGKAAWAKLNKPDKTYDYWGLELELDEASKEKFKESGLQLKVKKNKEDKEYISLRRPIQKVIKNELVDFDPPVLLDAKNNPYDPRPDVGNGSTVTCKVLVYDTVKGKGHRLEGVRVDDLIEYVRDNGEAPF